MKPTRLLLPFSHSIHECALEHAVLLAKEHNAILVPAALICVSERQKTKGVRLEHIQQSKDFLEAVVHKANKFSVPVEKVEVLTGDIAQGVDTLVKELQCQGVLLFVGGKKSVLLDYNDVNRIVKKATYTLYVFRIEPKENVSICKWH